MAQIKLKATAVIELTDRNIEFLKKIQMNHPIPEGAKYIAFLEDGDACFLETIDSGDRFSINMPHMHMITYYEDIEVEFNL